MPPGDSATRPRVLVVDDEPPIRRFLRTGLESFGYAVSEAATASEALHRAAVDRADLIILDLGLPDADGQEVIRRVREWSRVPIIVLSVRSDEAGKIAALDEGADDYVPKPFGMGELMARVRAALRRRLREEVPEPVFETGGLRVDLAARAVSVDGVPARLTPKEYDLMRALVRHAGKILTHRQLMAEVWPDAVSMDLPNLRVLVAQLRRKIEPDPAVPRYITVEPGVGYRLELADGE
jgi:two-component system, OmpR family, KDP operon response regulator KdpE